MRAGSRWLAGATGGAFLALALVGCTGTPVPGGGGELGGGSAPVRAVPRWSINRRAVYALEELQPLARELSGQLAGSVSDRPARVAFYYVTEGGRKSFLGEAIAQDLATLLVEESAGAVEIYTRRKLGRVEEELKRQLTDLYDPATLARLGKLSGVDAILSGRLVRQGDEILLNTQILDVRTGDILGGKKTRIPAAAATARRPVRTLEDTASQLAAALAADLPEDREWRLAIYDVTRSKDDFSTGREVAEAIATDLASSSGHIRPLTRSALAQVLEEQRLERSDLFEEETRVRIAQLAGGNVILAGFAEIFRDFYLINVQVIEVESARILAGEIGLVRRRTAR